ncbi:hypothetical protein [Streptomyces sp. 8N706]|uniref:hypothetical protein n=1 Tax=Streptomyces sp. 8N706 TaxID=3457416 RepID=UPI003FD393B0
MNLELTYVTLIALVLAVSVLFVVLAGMAVGTIARLDGATLPSALQRGGVAFGGTLTLLLTAVSSVAGLLR